MSNSSVERKYNANKVRVPVYAQKLKPEKSKYIFDNVFIWN